MSTKIASNQLIKTSVLPVLCFRVSARICTNFFEVCSFKICCQDNISTADQNITVNLFNSSFMSHTYHLNSAFSDIDGEGHTSRASEFLIFDLFLLIQMD